MEEGAEVLRLQVDPERRRRGIGRALMGRLREFCLAEGARRIKLTTISLHSKAVQLYKSLGYELVSSRRNGTITLLDFALELARDAASSQDVAEPDAKRARTGV